MEPGAQATGAMSTFAALGVGTDSSVGDSTSVGNDHSSSKLDRGGGEVVSLLPPEAGATNGAGPMTTEAGAGATAGAPVVVQPARYKVCMEGGVPTLQEATGQGDDGDDNDDDGDGDGINVGNRSEPSSALEEGRDVSPLSSGEENGAGAGAGSTEFSDGSGSPTHGAFMGMDGIGMAANAAAAVAGDFGPPMTDAEAVSIAGGAFFGFGGDMRVSI